MRLIATISLFLLAGCTRESEKATAELDILERNHAGGNDLCKARQKLATAYLGENDEKNYSFYKGLADTECMKASYDPTYAAIGDGPIAQQAIKTQKISWKRAPLLRRDLVRKPPGQCIINYFTNGSPMFTTSGTMLVANRDNASAVRAVNRNNSISHSSFLPSVIATKVR